MEQAEITVQKRSASQRRCRRKRKQRRMRFASVSVFLLVAVFLLARFLPNREKEADPPAGNIAVSDEQIQILSPQTTSAPSTVTQSQTVWQPVTSNNWKLLLVNHWNSLPEGYSIETVTLKNGLKVDERCYPDLQAMMDACQGDGLSPVICSAYRTREKQEQLYQKKVEGYLAQGYSQDQAETEAGKIVAVPGTSEHQLGLAVDIVDINYQHLDEMQESTEVQKWLIEHSWEYGFILRYPNGKSEITGIIYEPWHYRYVGREAAEQMHTLGVCLEEYLAGGN